MEGVVQKESGRMSVLAWRVGGGRRESCLKPHLPGRRLPTVSFLDNHQVAMKKKPATTKGPPMMSPATTSLRPAAIPPNIHPAIPHAVITRLLRLSE